MPEYVITNWNKYQHYTKRNPPWVKLHFSMLSSPDWVMVDDASRVLAIACMLIASKHEGRIPASCSPEYFKRVAYLNKLPNFKPLVSCGFLQEVLADDSTSKHMLATARPEKEKEKEKEKRAKTNGHSQKEEVATEKKYAFEDGHIRLTEKHFNEMVEAYTHLDVRAELMGASGWLQTKENWWHALKAYLAKKNREMHLASKPRAIDNNNGII